MGPVPGAGKTTRTGIKVHCHEICAGAGVQIIQHSTHRGNVACEAGSDQTGLGARTACHGQEIVEMIFLRLDEDVVGALEISLNSGRHMVAHQHKGNA